MVKSSIWVWYNRYLLSRRIRGIEAQRRGEREKEKKKKKKQKERKEDNDLFS